MEEHQQPNYHAFLLRLWREEVQLPWRASLENPHTGEKLHFAKLDRLIAFLQQVDDGEGDDTTLANK